MKLYVYVEADLETAAYIDSNNHVVILRQHARHNMRVIDNTEIDFGISNFV